MTASTTPLIYRQMAKVVAALSHIPKQRSQGVNYEFRGIDAVMNVLHGPLADNGLFLAPRVLDDWQLNMIPGSNSRVQGQALFRVEVEVFAEDGSSVTLGPGLAQSHDYGDKAVYQAQQNALKYLLLESFCIPTSEQDMDARESDPVPQQPRSQPAPGPRQQPAARPAAVPDTPPPSAGEAASAPDVEGTAHLVALAARAGIRKGSLLSLARSIAGDKGWQPPTSLDELSDDLYSAVIADVTPRAGAA